MQVDSESIHQQHTPQKSQNATRGDKLPHKRSETQQETTKHRKTPTPRHATHKHTTEHGRTHTTPADTTIHSNTPQHARESATAHHKTNITVIYTYRKHSDTAKHGRTEHNRHSVTHNSGNTTTHKPFGSRRVEAATPSTPWHRGVRVQLAARRESSVAMSPETPPCCRRNATQRTHTPVAIFGSCAISGHHSRSADTLAEVVGHPHGLGQRLCSA